MGRKEGLEYNIHESYQLIREYEEILRTSSDPKERARAQRAIKDQRELIEGWSAEYQRISGQMPPQPAAKPAGSSEPSVGDAVRSEERPHSEPQKPVPWLGYPFVVLLGVDLVVVGILGWRFLGNQPELLSYLQVVTGFLALALEIFLLGIALQRKMTFAVSPTSWSPCRIESFAAEPPSPQPVGGLVIFKIRGTCESGVRAIRLLINDEWYDEKGGHIAPPEEFVPIWSTQEEAPGDYKITAEVATWKDDAWKFAASQALTYTLVASSTIDDNP